MTDGPTPSDDAIDIGDGHSIVFVSYLDDPKTGINHYHPKPDGVSWME
jgi:hypothetical protein